MPSPYRWPVPSLQPLSHPGNDDATRRSCGCIADPVVFGHDKFTCTIRLAGAA